MSRPYTVLFTMSEFMYGSKLRNVCDLVAGIDRETFRVEIGALEIDNEALPEIESLGVPFYRLRTIPTLTYNMRRLGQFACSPLQILSHRYDLVHSFLYQSLLTEPLILKTFSRSKYIYTKPNLQWDNHRFNWHLKSKLADKIVSISKATDDLLASKGFGHKICKICLGIDTNEFQTSQPKRSELRQRLKVAEATVVFGCAAQFVEWKEHLTVISAFEILCRRHSDLHLVFAGPNHSDGYYQRVVERIRTSPAREKIALLGTVQDMRAFYSAIDCFVLVSRNEPFGYVYIEAMSCGRPVIACRAGGPLEIVSDGETGLLVRVSSSEDLIIAMERYVTDIPLLRAHGQAARERAVAQFSKEVMVTKTQELYISLLGQCKK
jgi:glycosyltransferase involved in cell wall biosynthesis